MKIEWKQKENKVYDLCQTGLSLGYERFVINNFMEDIGGGKGKKKKEKPVIVKGPDILLNSETVKDFKSKGHKFEQLSRFTTMFNDPAIAHQIDKCPEVMSYDILALQPVDEKTFQIAAQKLDADIICVDLTEHISYIKRTMIKVAVERGIHIELVYSPALRDSGIKCNVIANAQTLVGAARGRNIIISSGAQEVLDLRSPYDVINLGKLFGLSHSQAKDAITKHCRSVLKHAETRKTQQAAVSVDRLSSLSEKDRQIVESQLKKLSEITAADDDDDDDEEVSDDEDDGDSSDESETEEPPEKRIKS